MSDSVVGVLDLSKLQNIQPVIQIRLILLLCSTKRNINQVKSSGEIYSAIWSNEYDPLLILRYDS